MSRLGRWMARGAVVALVATGSSVASAVAPPQITVAPSTRQAEVGETFTIQLKAMVDRGDPEPSSPELVPPRDVTILGQSAGSQTMMMMGAGAPVIRTGISAQWQLMAQRPGRFTIPAPTVMWNGHRVAGTPVTIEIVAATGRPRAQPGNPFLFPGGGSFGFPPFALPSPEPDEEPRLSRELALPTAPDSKVFVTTRLDKQRVVVGEQVSLSVYVYFNPRINVRTIENHDPPLSDFLRVPITRAPGTDAVVAAMAGNQKFVAQLVDQMAIFPLHAGDLHTGSVRFTFVGGPQRSPLDRSSNDAIVHVVEPPRAGRPVGYTLGDVGQFTLTAEVEPRHIKQGGEVAVKLRLAGKGNLPQSVRVPERTNVEWLDPERKESIETQRGVVGGWRTFGYVVRINESGQVDLGEVSLPYWDPEANSYQVARAVLGKVEVSPASSGASGAPSSSTAGPASDPGAAAAPDPFVTLPGVRLELGPAVAARRPRFEGAPLWASVAAPPLLFAAASLATRLARRAAARRAEVGSSPTERAAQALAEARAALAAGDARTLTTCLERALHLAIEGATGLKSRGILLADLERELTDRDMDEALAGRAREALEACEALRFDPGASDAPQELFTRVSAVTAEMARDRRRPS